MSDTETVAERAFRLLGSSHKGAGSRLGDLTEALRVLERLDADLSDAIGFAGIPIGRCPACKRLSVPSGYCCRACGADPTDTSE